MSTQVSKHAQLKMNKASKLEALQASLKSVARMKLDIEHLKALQEVYEHQVTLHQSAATKTPVKSAAKSVASDEAKPKRQKTKVSFLKQAVNLMDNKLCCQFDQVHFTMFSFIFTRLTHNIPVLLARTKLSAATNPPNKD
jgi:hypothetical protein